MPTELQFRRYSLEDINALTGKVGEIFILMGEPDGVGGNFPWSLRIQDGITPGGIPLNTKFSDLVGSPTDNPDLNTALSAKAPLADFEDHYNGVGFKHTATHITFDGSQPGINPASISTNVNEALVELYDIKSDVVNTVRTTSPEADNQTIRGQNTTYLNLAPTITDAPAGVFIGSPTHPGGIGNVSTLRLYSTSGFYYDLVTDATTGLFALDFYNGATTQTIITTNAQADLIVDKNLRVKGNIYLGDTQLDTITAIADFSSNLVPSAPDTYDLGTSIERWNTLYANNAVIENDLTVKGDIYLGDDLIQDTIAFGGLITSDLISGLDPYGDRYNLGTSTERWNTLYTNVGNFDNLEIFLDGTTHYIAPNSSATSNALTIGLHTDGTITDALVLEAKESLALDTTLGSSTTGGDISLTSIQNIILTPGTDIGEYVAISDIQIKNNVLYAQSSNEIIEMSNTGALKIPSGTTALRPTGGNQAAGQIRFNETEFEFEGYNGTEWGALGGGGGTQLIDTDADTTLSVEQPEGTDTDTLVFEISSVQPLSLSSTTGTIDVSGTLNIGSANAATLNLGNNTSSTGLSGSATSINSTNSDLNIFTGASYANGTSKINLHAGLDTSLSEITLTGAAGITLTSGLNQPITLNAPDSLGTGGVIVNGPVDITGNAEVTGDLEVNHATTPGTNGLILESPDGTRWKITVDNNGSLTTTALP